MTAPTVTYQYVPHPRQQVAHNTIVGELLYGGAAGGGKSRWARAEAVRTCLLIPGARVALFRRTFPDLRRAVIDYLRAEMPPGVATYNVADHEWRFTNGSILELASLDLEGDIYKYQGAEYALVIFEEITQFTQRQYKYLLSRLRVAGQVLNHMRQLGLRPRALATGNPGGVGHQWVRARWIDPAPPGTAFTPTPTVDEPEPLRRCYIPARVADNPSIDLDAYNRQLGALDPAMRRALRHGDWDILEGVRYPQWRRQTHVITPDQMPLPLVGYPRAVGVDYGMTAPFAALWGALLPDNLIVIYRELYQTGLTPTEQAEAIRDAEQPGERTRSRPLPVALDPACWARAATNPTAHGTNGPPPGSIAHAYRHTLGATVVKANNSRLAGWSLVDEHLRVRADGLPRLLVYDTCINLIRTLPALPRAKNNPEDVDTHTDDHIADALRYLLQQLAPGGIPRVAPDPAAARPEPALTAGVDTKRW